MQILFFRILLAILTPAGDADAEGLHSFAPNDDAYAHMWVARVTAAIYVADMDMVTWRLYYAAHDLPDVERPELIDAFIAVALDVQTPRVPAALLVALAWGESRFDAAARPACGVMQVYPRDLGEHASACEDWRRNLAAGVRAGVREIEMMLDDKRVRGDMRRALLYRACGNSAFDGTCKAEKHLWVTVALARWRSLTRDRRAGS